MIVLAVAGLVLIGTALGSAVTEVGSGVADVVVLVGVFMATIGFQFGLLNGLRARIVPGPRGWLRSLDERGTLVPYRVDERRGYLLDSRLQIGMGLIGLGLIAGAVAAPFVPWLLSALLAIALLTTVGLLAAG